MTRITIAASPVAVAFVLVDVPRGFRPPDPLERALERFEIDEGRFAAQVLVNSSRRYWPGEFQRRVGLH